ncbi:MAG: metal ABC transporter substrate-binding protein [Actinomycetaceae bacterium]|nr:metal ABC transporter substrate-binding protein [Actinomycetaceae bacterium]
MMKRKLLALTALSTATLFALAGCSTPGNTDAKAKDSTTTEVLTAFYPLEFLTTSIGGKHVKVTSMAPAGAGAHGMELSANMVAKMSDASAIVYLSGFQASVDEAIAQVKPTNAVDVKEAVQLLTFGEIDSANEQAHDHDQEDHDHEGHDHAHGDEHADEEHEEHEEHAGHAHTHAPGDTDPHFWLDPSRMAKAVTPIKEALIKVDPANKADYEANAKDIEEKLSKLYDSFKTGLATCAKPTAIVSHKAYGYLSSQFGFTQVGMAGFDPEQEATPNQIAEVGKIAEAQGVKVIFTEDLINSKTADQLAKDLGIRSEILDPVESQANTAKDYIAVMTDNLTKLSSAMECTK